MSFPFPVRGVDYYADRPLPRDGGYAYATVATKHRANNRTVCHSGYLTIGEGSVVVDLVFGGSVTIPNGDIEEVVFQY